MIFRNSEYIGLKMGKMPAGDQLSLPEITEDVHDASVL
jgi:hypothetical protein